MGKTIDFVIPAKQSQEARRIKQHVVDLFQVQISFVSSPGTVSQTGVEWIQVCGEEDRVFLAKEYIISACTPEETKVVDVPCVLHELLIDDEVSPLPLIEKEYTSSIQYDPAQGICIRGKTVEVALIVSYLEQEIPKWKDMEVAKKTSLPSQGQRRDFVQRDVRNYIRRLGYSDSQIDVAASKCGPALTENSLLQELLVLFGSDRCGESNILRSQNQVDNARSSYGKLEERATTKIVAEPSSTTEEGTEETTAKLRHIVVDGSNVAMCHGNKEKFSCKGIQICVDWFKNRGHSDITVIVPQWRKEESKNDNPILDREILLQLEKERILVFTPSRRVNGKRVVCYDDRYIVKVAAEEDGIIVSNDHFRDLERESPDYKQVIDQRLLMYTFVNDKFMPPDDPLGRHGPSLGDFLKKGTPLNPKLCPYGRRCTYGQKCRYYHPKKEAELLKRDLEVKKIVGKADICKDILQRQIEIRSLREEEFPLKKTVSPQSRPSSYPKIRESEHLNNAKHVLDSAREEVRSSQPNRSCALEALPHCPEFLKAGVDVVSRGQDAGLTQTKSAVPQPHIVNRVECQVSPRHVLRRNSSGEEHHKLENFRSEGCSETYSQPTTKLCSSQISHYEQDVEQRQRVELGTTEHEVIQSSTSSLHSMQDGHLVANGHRGMVSNGVNQTGLFLMPLQQGCLSTQTYSGNVGHLPSVPSAVYPLNYDSFSYTQAQQWMAVPQPAPFFVTESPHVVPFAKRFDVNMAAASSVGNGTDILLELQRRFPGQNDRILQILRQYPQESDIHILSWLIQNSHTP